MFEQNTKKEQKQINEVQKKKKQKATMEYAFMLKRMGCAQGRKNVHIAI